MIRFSVFETKDKMEGAQFCIMASFIHNSQTCKSISIISCPLSHLLCQDHILGYECGHPELLKISNSWLMKICSHLKFKMEGTWTSYFCCFIFKGRQYWGFEMWSEWFQALPLVLELCVMGPSLQRRAVPPRFPWLQRNWIAPMLCTLP